MTIPEARKPGLSVFFPAYNDSGTIASLVIAALGAARKLTPDFEVIIVNDGSADATAEIANELARTYPEVKVVHHERNRGYGGALMAGIEAARGQGLDVPWEAADVQIDRTRQMGAYRASTLIDFERGQPLELESLFGEPLRRARRAGVRAEWLGRLYQVLAELEPAARRRRESGQ